MPSVAGLEALNYQLQMKPIRSTTLDITTTPAIAARCCYAPVRLICTHLIRCKNPFLFQFFCGIAKIAPQGQKLFSLIIKQLATTIKNKCKIL